MNEEQLKEFERELNERGFSTQREMIKWIYERFGIEYCQQGMSNLLKRIGARKKVGRPVNVRKDERKEREFKEKRFKEIARENPDKEFFYDESRFGLMTDVGRQWRGRGIKPIIPKIMKFEYRYLYTSVSPMTGESFSFVMADMTTES